MNEEKKMEICDEQLEDVSGGKQEIIPAYNGMEHGMILAKHGLEEQANEQNKIRNDDFIRDETMLIIPRV